MCSTAEEAIRKVLIELSKDNFEPYSTYSLIKRENVKSLCINLKSLFDWDFNFEEFHNALCDMQHFPLELLWNFHIFQILPLETYLLNISSIQKFKENVITFCLQDSKEDSSLFFSQTGILSFLVNYAFAEFDESLPKEDLKEICKSIVESFMQSILSLSEKDFSLSRLKPFLALWSCGTIENSSLHLFSYFSLQKFLNESSSSSVADAFIPHSNWKNKSDPYHLLPVIEKLAKILKPEELVQILNKVVWKDDINWKHVAVFLTSIPGERSPAKKTVTELVRDGLDHFNYMSIQKAVLIGRQISLKSNDSFPLAYTSWMQTFIWENIKTKSFQGISLLIQVLSDLVPYEKEIDCIKLVLGKPVTVPQECQSLYSDYIILLKTRVKDLQPCVNTEAILKKVLNLFEENGKIPPYVLEASLMHKQHYLNEFLPTLLKPRVIPTVTNQQIPTVPDIKEKFIEKLNKSGKIPCYIYQQYKFSCQQEQQNLLAGINLADDFIELTDI